MARLPAVVFLAGGMAAYGSSTPVSAIVGRSFPVYLASAARMAVAAAVLVPLLIHTRRRRGDPPLRTSARRLPRRDWALLFGIAAIGTFGFSVLMLLGMQRAPGAAAAVVMATTPAVTAVGAVIFLGDHLGPWRVFAVVLGVGGVVLVNLGADTAEGAGDAIVIGSILVFGAVLCEATYSLMGKRLTADLDALTIVTAAATLALVLFAPLAVWDAVRFDWSAPTAGQWIGVVWWGAGTMALGSWMWFRGMSQVQAGTAAPFMAVMPVSALVLSYVLLGESFQLIHAVGMALVLAGLAAVIRSGAAVH
jgi:drug/metabolite transporter (DMT)-like permease